MMYFPVVENQNRSTPFISLNLQAKIWYQ